MFNGCSVLVKTNEKVLELEPRQWKLDDNVDVLNAAELDTSKGFQQ